MNNDRELSPETLVTHQPVPRLSPGNDPLVAPIHQSVKYTFESIAEVERHLRGEREGYFYSRVRNPTVAQLEQLTARLQGREQGWALASGVAAISTCLLGLLSAGDHVILFRESYKPSRALARDFLARFGVRHTILSIHDHAAIESAVIPGTTKVILFESPTNPMLHVADVGFLTDLARRHGLVTVMDNTFAGFHNHGNLPVDIFLHSLTKYACGHGDVTGGMIIADDPLMRRVRSGAREIGACMDPHAAFLTLRGMKTYYLRFERQCANARRVAEWLSSCPSAERVMYPGLSSHPGHSLTLRQAPDGGAVVAFDVVGGAAAMRSFLDRLSLFRLAASLGSTESLVAPADLFYADDLTPEERVNAGIRPGSVRLSIGIEAAEDLIRDLARALQVTT